MSNQTIPANEFKAIYEIVVKSKMKTGKTTRNGEPKTETHRLIFHYVQSNTPKDDDLIYLVKWQYANKNVLLSLNVENGDDRFFSESIRQNRRAMSRLLQSSHNSFIVPNNRNLAYRTLYKAINNSLIGEKLKDKNDQLLKIEEKDKLLQVCQASMNSTKKGIRYFVRKINADTAKYYTYKRKKEYEDLLNSEKGMSDFELLFHKSFGLFYSSKDETNTLKKLLLKDKKFDNEHLPFIKMENKIDFPIKIDNTQNEKLPEREEDIIHQKAYFAVGGSAFFNGNNVRVLKIENNTMEVAHCGYFDIQGTADYIPSRIKAYSTLHMENPKELTYGTKSKNLEKKYKERIDKIKLNNFTGEDFCSGLGFSMPIFLISKEKDGKEKFNILYAKGSEQKAAGGDLLHVAPAGMFEIYEKEKGQLTQITYENFVTVLAKELLEELYFGKGIDTSKILPEIRKLIEPFFESEGGSPAQLTFEQYLSSEQKIATEEKWETIWKNQFDDGYKPTNKVLKHVLEHVSNKQYFEKYAFLVLDPLRLRPELIVPIYLKGKQFDAMLNWEYNNRAEKANDKDSEKRTNPWEGVEIEKGFEGWVEFLNRRMRSGGPLPKYKKFVAPGLAATYLGAEHFFDGHVEEEDICLID